MDEPNRRARLAAVAFVLFAPALACTGSDRAVDTSSTWPIPAEANRLTKEAPSSAASERLMDAGLVSAVERLRSAQKSWTVGRLEGPSSQTWALLSAVGGALDGEISTLDAMNVEVRFFTEEGEFTHSLLREGDGPLEMRRPTGLIWLEPDTLIVYSSAQVRYISVAEDGDFRYARSIQYPRGISDLCALDHALFARISSPTADGTVVELGPDGQEVRTWGEMANTPDPGLRAQLSMGGLACTKEGGEVVATYAHESPLLHGYNRGGELIWTTYIQGFSPPVIEEQDIGGSRGISRPGENESDRVLTFTPLGTGPFLLQVARLGPTTERRGRRVQPVLRRDSYVIQPSTGKGVFVGTSVPQVLYATDSALYAVTSDEDEGFLRLEAYEW